MKEMPQSAPSCASSASCCHEGQTPPAPAVQRDVRSEAPDVILAQSAPEIPAVVAPQFETAVVLPASGSPPDRQSLFCTLLI